MLELHGWAADGSWGSQGGKEIPRGKGVHVVRKIRILHNMENSKPSFPVVSDLGSGLPETLEGSICVCCELLINISKY